MSGDVNRDVTITFIGRDNASAAMRSISGTAVKTTSTASRLASVLKKVAAVAATALAAAAVIGAKAIWDFTKAAYADSVAMEKLAFVQRKAQDATDAQVKSTTELIDKLELATGIADDEMRPALQALASTGMSVAKSQDLLQVAMDVSVARGKSLQTVAEALVKGYNGQITGLSRLGVKTTDAAGETLEFSEIVDQLRKRFDGAARAAGKTDPIKRLTAAWNQTKEALGQGFLPLLRQFSKWMINTGVPWIKEHLVPAIKDFAEWIQRNKQNITGFMQVLQGAWKVLTIVWKVLSTVSRWLATAYHWFKSLFGLDWSFLTDVKLGLLALKNPMWAVRGWIDMVTQPFRDLASVVWSVVNAVERLGSAFMNLPGDALGWVGDKLGLASGGYLPRAQGGWTMVGEHGPELINNRGFVKTHSQSMGAGNAPVVINVNGAIDPVSTARQIERILAKGRRVTGVGGLATA